MHGEVLNCASTEPSIFGFLTKPRNKKFFSVAFISAFQILIIYNSEIEYLIDNPGWNAPNGWNFIFRYKVLVGNYENWTIKIEFSTTVTELTVICRESSTQSYESNRLCMSVNICSIFE